MTKFNWQMSTVQSLAEHIFNSPKESIRQQENYYKASGNDVMLDRIAKAKKLVLLWNLEKQLETLRKEVYE